MICMMTTLNLRVAGDPIGLGSWNTESKPGVYQDPGGHYPLCGAVGIVHGALH